MEYYKYIRKILFCLDPEVAHGLTLESLSLIEKMRLTGLFPSPVSSPCKVMGLNFLNPVGIAAGLDKNGDYIDALAMLGFGFIEIGSITPKPQPGNAKPRLFRLVSHKALINRMGFNNKGVDYSVERLKQKKYQGILGINIGKNKETPIEKAADDYIFVFRRIAPFASYVTINISSPNTEKLRDLQQSELLTHLIRELKKEQALFFTQHKKYIPLVIKISPDLKADELAAMSAVFLAEKIDGVIATNTTIERSGIENLTLAKETGGLSGQPLKNRSTQIIKQGFSLWQNRIPIIGCGGIMRAEDAKEKIAAGASLLQIYTGLIYEGPSLVTRLLDYKYFPMN